MVDTAKCFSLVRGRALRVTRLDGCGGVILGADSAVVTDGFITVGLTAQTDEGTAISIPNAAGRICILDEPAPQFTGYAVEIALCGVNPDLIALMTGQSQVLDADDLAVGFRMNSKINADDSGFALEMWSNVPAGACDPAAGTSYGYFLIPFLKGGVIGDFTIANDAVNFTLTGARSKDGNAWGVGPYNVVDAGVGAVNTPSALLDGLDEDDHLHMQLTTIAPPSTDGCGTVAAGVPATLITAGSPATLTPTNAYPPATLAALIAQNPTKTPTTNWTTGQYVELGDGSKANWNGTAWVAGIHA